MRLVVLGNDKIGRACAAQVAALPGVTVVLDASSDIRRVVRLVRRRRLPIRAVMAMGWAELSRPPSAFSAATVRTNAELLDHARRCRAHEIYLFRAGLIVGTLVLSSGLRVLNVHCASLPDYGGMAAIWRALHDGAFQQAATLHLVTKRIDEGEVVAVEPYTLDPARSYGANEAAAYDAGRKLLIAALTHSDAG